MKKILSILSVLIIILMLFTSCNSVSEPTEKPSETSFPSETVDRKPTERPTQKPTEKPTEKPTKKPTEEPIVIPPREVTWDTSKYEAFYLPGNYLTIYPNSLSKYKQMLREQEGEPVISTSPLFDKSLYENFVPAETMTVDFLGEEYVGILQKNWFFWRSIRPTYSYKADISNKYEADASKFLYFDVDINGRLLYLVLNTIGTSNDLPSAPLEDCEEMAKQYFSIQLPELDIAEYNVTSYISEDNSQDRYIIFEKSVFDIVEQEKIVFNFNKNGKLKSFSYNRAECEPYISSIDIDEIRETIEKIATYTFHVENCCYFNCRIKISDDLKAYVLDDGSVVFEIQILAEYDEFEGDIITSASVKDLCVKVLK